MPKNGSPKLKKRRGNSWGWLILFILAICMATVILSFRNELAVVLPYPTTTPTATLTPTLTPTPTITPLPTLGVGSVRTSGANGMVMVYIPEGEFSMGSNEGTMYEQPVHTVYVDAFWLDQTEITAAMFVAFLNENGNRNAEGQYYWDINQSVGIFKNGIVWETKNGYEDFPVIGVNWFGAQAYCAWAGKRLPTEAEWEKAARGGLDNMKYPWGNDPPTCAPGADNGAQHVNCARSPSVVGSFGLNGYGLYDMAGNAAEWVSDWYDSIYYARSEYRNPQGPPSGIQKSRVLRGGSFLDTIEPLRVSYRFYYDARYTLNLFGFRCAAAP